MMLLLLLLLRLLRAPLLLLLLQMELWSGRLRRHPLRLFPHRDAHDGIGLVHAHEITFQAHGDDSIRRRDRKHLSNLHLAHVDDEYPVH